MENETQDQQPNAEVKSSARLRVETELAELSERLEKLDRLFVGYKPNHYDPEVPIWNFQQEERQLLMRQRATMQDYKQILAKRLKIWREPIA